MIAILDYGMGNLRSVSKAFSKLGFDCIITSDPSCVMKADKLVIPGVGAFSKAIKNLREKCLDKVIFEFEKTNKPILGICLGMQLLFDKSYEFGEYEGLGIIKGSVEKFKCDLKIPHMGWNNIECTDNCTILKNVNKEQVYFVHSYHVISDKKYASAYTNYGYDFICACQKNNVFGVQFHPEKSGEVGMKILKNFGDL